MPIVFLGFAAIAGYFLLAEHRVHALGILPWALLLLVLHRGRLRDAFGEDFRPFGNQGRARVSRRRKAPYWLSATPARIRTIA